METTAESFSHRGYMINAVPFVPNDRIRKRFMMEKVRIQVASHSRNFDKARLNIAIPLRTFVAAKKMTSFKRVGLANGGL